MEYSYRRRDGKFESMPGEADALVPRPWGDSDEGFKQFLAWQQQKKREEEAASSQADEDFLSTEKWRRRRKVAIWIVGILASGIGGAYLKFAPEPVAVVRPKDVKDTVDVRVGALEKSINGCETKLDAKGALVACSEEEQKASVKHTSEMADKKADRLGDLHFDQRGLILDIRQETIDKLDAKTVKEKRAVKEPPSVGLARDQVDAYKKRKNREKMEESLKKGDPFADL